MNSLPVETWTRIFALACVDGGRTGCALSETSKYFREAVMPVQVHSVALSGTRKMSKFLLGVVEKRPPHQRPVQHLFLSQGSEERVSQTQDVVHSLLREVGPTLRTLTTLLPQDLHFPGSVLRNPLPCLEELTIHGIFIGLSVSQPEVIASQPELVDSFPSLRYLHILSSCDTALLFIPRAPKLTHLRLSGVWSFSNEILAALTRAIDPDASFAATSGENSMSALRSLVIVPDLNAARIAQSQHHTRRGAWQELKERDKRNIVTLVESPYHQAVEGLPSKQVRRQQWEERIEGKAGCWMVADVKKGERGLPGERWRINRVNMLV